MDTDNKLLDSDIIEDEEQRSSTPLIVKVFVWSLAVLAILQALKFGSLLMETNIDISSNFVKGTLISTGLIYLFFIISFLRKRKTAWVVFWVFIILESIFAVKKVINLWFFSNLYQYKTNFDLFEIHFILIMLLLCFYMLLYKGIRQFFNISNKLMLRSAFSALAIFALFFIVPYI